MSRWVDWFVSGCVNRKAYIKPHSLHVEDHDNHISFRWTYKWIYYETVLIRLMLKHGGTGKAFSFLFWSDCSGAFVWYLLRTLAFRRTATRTLYPISEEDSVMAIDMVFSLCQRKSDVVLNVVQSQHEVLGFHWVPRAPTSMYWQHWKKQVSEDRERSHFFLIMP